MDSESQRSPGGRHWTASRPAEEATGPPGVAALLDAERSALRDLHARLRTLAERRHGAEARSLALDEARRLQADAARRNTRGMRDRLRAREYDRRLLVADARTALASATAALEAAEVQVRAARQRLDEARGLVDRFAGDDHAAVLGLRRPPTMPASARSFASIDAFIADRPARAVGDPRLHDLVGAPLGERWSLEDEAHPWITTRWRLAWDRDGDEASGEVYAVEQTARPGARRRVWLLGAIAPSPLQQLTLDGLLGHQAERNSLAAAAGAVAAG